MKNIKGDKQFINKLRAYKQALETQSETEIAGVILDMQADTTMKLQTGNRSGKIYKRGKNRLHQASAIGEFPKTDRGILVGSLFQKISKFSKKIEGIFGAKAKHGKWLEFKPAQEGGRPWLKPQFDKYSKILQDNISKINSSLIRKYFE